jgi:hypothetical protein
VDVLGKLRVGGELVVVTDIEAEELLRRGHGGRRLGRGHHGGRGEERDGQRQRAKSV